MTPSDDTSAPLVRWATSNELQAVEDRLSRRIDAASGKGVQYTTLLLVAVAAIGSLLPHISIG